MNPWTGTIAHVGRPTADGRRSIARLEWDHLPIPLTDAHPDAAPIGRIETIDRRPDGTVHATGTVDLRPGTYAVGVWLTALGPGKFELRREGESHLEVTGRLIGATVHDDLTASAWPDSIITVTAAPVTLTGGRS